MTARLQRGAKVKLLGYPLSIFIYQGFFRATSPIEFQLRINGYKGLLSLFMVGSTGQGVRPSPTKANPPKGGDAKPRV